MRSTAASSTTKPSSCKGRLDTATALEETTRSYVERLEAMVDEQRLPSGDDLISEIERFLREGGTEGTPRSG